MEFVGESIDRSDYAAVALDGSISYLQPSRQAPPAQVEHRRASVGAMAEDFRGTMRALASGVVLITTAVDGRPWGVTVSSCCSLSVEPARLLVSLMRGTASHRAIETGGTFGANLLGDAHRRLAQAGAAPGSPKFLDPQDIDDRRGTPSPMIDGALSFVDCEVERIFEVGDHAIIVGRVLDAVPPRPHSAASPLLYFDGGFYHLGGPM